MSTLTPEGLRLVRELARRHGFGEDAVTLMLTAVVTGQGRMAQFAHPEFGGSGQWMSGGMLMIGDMFNQTLKGRVGALCTDLAQALEGTEPLVPQASAPSGAWWPDGLGRPSATGAQNATRYAYFADTCRLALDDGREITVHDTLDHRIGGFSQQQGGREGVSMTSQHGTLDPRSLPLVASPAEASPPPVEPAPEPAPEPAADEPAPPREDPVLLIERLGELHERGLLSDEEFSSKKAELLARL